MLRRALPVIAVTLLAACGGGGDDGSVEVASAPTVAPAPSAPSPDDASGAVDGDAAGVPAALDLTAPLVGGGEIELGAYAGRPVLLWFWAPW